MKVKKWSIHFMAECEDCNWDTADHVSGRQKAHDHHRRTGHAIHGELGVHYEWRRIVDGPID